MASKNRKQQNKPFHSDSTGEYYTSSDLLHLIQARVRKDWRIHKLLDSKQTYSIVSDKKLTTQILLFLLKDIFAERLLVQEVEQESDATHKLLDTSCREEFLSARLELFLQGKSLELFKHSPLSPLRTISAHEIKQLATILNLTGEEPKEVCLLYMKL